MRSIDFSLYYNGQQLDLATKTLDDYNIPPAGLILVVESMMELAVGLPTGNEKVYTILKSKRVVDLKERISVISSSLVEYRLLYSLLHRILWLLTMELP